jgi:hypothetical protein
MTAYYTKEKAKFGGVTGTIIAYPIAFAGFTQQEETLPAGFLKCDGSIFKASTYPALAAVIGIGSACSFDKSDIDDDEIQLPDIGSKYIRISNGSGAYLNDRLTSDPDTFVVGTEITVESLIGNEFEISYDGYFQLIGQDDLEFIGQPSFTVLSGSSTPEDVLTADFFQAHTHSADTRIFNYLANWDDNAFVAPDLSTGEPWNSNEAQGGDDGVFEGSNDRIITQPVVGGVQQTGHSHELDVSNASEIKANNNFRFRFGGAGGAATELTPEDVQIPASNLRSTVTVNTSTLKKLDDITPPFYLVEYFIKI